MKDKFFLTFGNKYRHELHPSGVKINPDGYVVIHAYNFNDACNLAFSKFGDAWCFIYEEGLFNASHFPAGIITEIGNKEDFNV